MFVIYLECFGGGIDVEREVGEAFFKGMLINLKFEKQYQLGEEIYSDRGTAYTKILSQEGKSHFEEL